MSAAPHLRPERARRTAPTESSRPRLRLVSSPLPAKSPAPFVALLISILAGAMLVVLYLNISMAQTAYDIHEQQIYLGELEREVIDREAELEHLGSPTSLEERAEDMGMERPDTTYFLDLESGEIEGTEEP